MIRFKLLVVPVQLFKSHPFFTLDVGLFESAPYPLVPFAVGSLPSAVLFLFLPFSRACPFPARAFLFPPIIGHTPDDLSACIPQLARGFLPSSLVPPPPPSSIPVL